MKQYLLFYNNKLENKQIPTDKLPFRILLNYLLSHYDIVPVERIVGCNDICIFSLGGDGTFLKAFHGVYEKIEMHNSNEDLSSSEDGNMCRLFFYPFNYGTFGYWCTLQPSESLIENMKSIKFRKILFLEGTAVIEKNNLINTNCSVVCAFENCDAKEKMTDSLKMIYENEQCVSFGFLNEMLFTCTTIGKRSIFCLKIDFQNKNENVCIENIPCDGILISTRNGSTAYNKSASGPILLNDHSLVINFLNHLEPSIVLQFSKTQEKEHSRIMNVRITLKMNQKNNILVLDGNRRVENISEIILHSYDHIHQAYDKEERVSNQWIIDNSMRNKNK